MKPCNQYTTTTTTTNNNNNTNTNIFLSLSLYIYIYTYTNMTILRPWCPGTSSGRGSPIRSYY